MRFNLLILGAFSLLFSYSIPASQIKSLSKSRYWQILGHYKNGVSEIDDKTFFVSSYGKKSPFSELNATIQRLIHPKYKNSKSVYCKYPARREWIQKMLPNLPVKKFECKKLKKELSNVQNITKIYLIFPTTNLNSPASMFGHTLLRLDANDTTLTSYAVNFAATIQNAGAFAYAFKGIFGGFKGNYAIVPYYEKLNEYSLMESRDIWEYRLNLTPKEIHRLILHLYEIKNHWSRYYYFNKNCSYEILWLLEAANPKLNLTNRFNYKVLPIDTIKAINKEHLIISSNFRPSKREKILYFYKKIKNRPLALEFIRSYNLNIIKNLPLYQKTDTLDFALEYLRYQRLKGSISNKKYLKTYIKLLKARSRLPYTKIDIKRKINPLNTHDSNKVSFLFAKKSWLFEYKPAFHYINDSDYGFDRGYYIDFFDFQFQHRKHHPFLKSFSLVRIKSLSVRNDVFKPFSWGVDLGSEEFKNNREYLKLKTVLGVTYLKGKLLYSFLLTPEIYYKNRFEFGKGAQLYTEYETKSYKFNFSVKREFYSFKNATLIHAAIIKRVKRNLNFLVQYDKSLYDNCFWAGFSLYFF